ncbi:hypothetical protein [Paraburkholderia xenovorans]|jgi:hypothetical protein
MDRLIAPNSVIAAQADTAPATGTPQYATDGNPATNVPATQWPAYQYNAIQEELIAVLVAAGITPDRTENNQVAAAIKALIQGVAGVTPIIGSVRNLAMTVSAASATATVTADEIVVGTALGGSKLTLGSFNKSINLAIVGAGGMDIGAAPASSFLGIYALANPLTGASTLLGQSANGIVLPNVYAGGHAPAGYTESALLTVVPTNASSQIVPCVVQDRSVDIVGASILSTSTTAASPTVINNLVVPLNAKSCSGFLQIGSSAAASVSMSLFSSAASTNSQAIALTLTSNGSIAAPFNRLKITIGQRVFYQASSSAGTPTFSAQVTSYEI